MVENKPIEIIENLFSYFEKIQKESIQFAIIDLFVNISYFMPDFVTYFNENNGIDILEEMISPRSLMATSQNLLYFKSLFRLIQNVSSYYAESFTESTFIEMLKTCTRLDDRFRLVCTTSIINFFRKLVFTTQENKMLVLDALNRFFTGHNSQTRENVLWCVYYQLQIDEFFISDLASSKLISSIVDSVVEKDNSNVSKMALTILIDIVSFDNITYIEKIANSGIFEDAIELINNSNVSDLSLRFINEIMKYNTEYIEYFLENNLYANLIDVFHEGTFFVKKECVFFWSTIELYGTEEQKRVTEQDIVIELFCEALDIPDGEVENAILTTFIFMFRRKIELIQYIDTDVVSSFEESTDENIRELTGTLHSMYDQFVKNE